MSEKKKKSLGKKIALVIVLVILLAGVTVVVKNYDNIVALYKGLTTSTDELNTNIEQNKKDSADALANAGLNISSEDFDKLNDGSLTADEIAAIIHGSITQSGNVENETEADGSNVPEVNTPVNENSVPENTGTESDNTPEQNTPVQNDNKPDINTEFKDNSAETAKPETPADSQSPPVVTEKTHTGTPIPPVTEQAPSQTKTETTAMSEDEYNKKVADLVAKMYVIKSDFLSTLTEFENRIISEYKALPEEQRTTATKAKIVADNMSYVVSLEAQCDAQVEAVTSELTELMKANGKDTALVDAIKAAYINEKELKKAYYVSLYK